MQPPICSIIKDPIMLHESRQSGNIHENEMWYPDDPIIMTQRWQWSVGRGRGYLLITNRIFDFIDAHLTDLIISSRLRSQQKLIEIKILMPEEATHCV